MVSCRHFGESQHSCQIKYSFKILAQADACQHGELGELLRSEKLYSAQLQTWRHERAKNGVDGLSKSKPGPTAKHTPEQKRIHALDGAISAST